MFDTKKKQEPFLKIQAVKPRTLIKNHLVHYFFYTRLIEYIIELQEQRLVVDEKPKLQKCALVML